MQLPRSAQALHNRFVKSHELLVRLGVDASVILLGLVCVLVRRDATRARLAGVPFIAVALACVVLLACMVATRVLAVLSRPVDARDLALAEAGICLLVGIFAGVGTPGLRKSARVIRGTRIVAGAPARWPSGRGPSLLFAGVPVPAPDEAKHFKVLGTTGTGKTTVIRSLLAGALRRGDRAVIADPDGVYRREFRDRTRGDVLLNPLDGDSVSWDLFAEIDRPEDSDLLARALIPEQGGEDRAWRAYARVLVASLLRQLIHADHREVPTLHRLVAHASVEELRELLDGTAAAAYVSIDNARFLASVRAIASADLAVLELVGRQRSARRVAVRPWIRKADDNAPSGVLFLPYRSGQLATLRGLLAAWMRLAIFEALDAGEEASPLWFVVDELDAIGAIDGLKDALARLRKYGGRCVLGLQSISQLSGTYGSPAAHTIIENCGNTLLLRCSAGENGGTARFASTLIGEREVLRDQVSRTRPLAFGRGDRSRSETLQRHVERAVLPAEIEQLPDFHGYVKLASSPTWHQVVVRR
jgi:type IV secretory pathway TraG/TraD family ATPase VirD4